MTTADGGCSRLTSHDVCSLLTFLKSYSALLPSGLCRTLPVLSSLPLLPLLPVIAQVAMENSSVASASSEAGSTRSQEIEELERFIDSYVLEYQVQGILGDKTDGELDNGSKVPQVRAPAEQGAVPLAHEWNHDHDQLLPTFSAQWTDDFNNKKDGSWTSSRGRGSIRPVSWSHCRGCL